ncbi:hypothetical protein ARMGADRAFT_1030938 [Armillaria gallica]|uniref:Uncharacterized protein n=1 Tax=Armillaria gallica TaxID=47427 RepID=A0A2H3DFX0_ARMGA|nr:hypothetical protein ARMGADRAFT_1030938 [Armillaria gallica]
MIFPLLPFLPLSLYSSPLSVVSEDTTHRAASPSPTWLHRGGLLPDFSPSISSPRMSKFQFARRHHRGRHLIPFSNILKIMVHFFEAVYQGIFALRQRISIQRVTGPQIALSAEISRSMPCGEQNHRTEGSTVCITAYYEGHLRSCVALSIRIDVPQTRSYIALSIRIDVRRLEFTKVDALRRACAPHNQDLNIMATPTSIASRGKSGKSVFLDVNLTAFEDQNSEFEAVQRAQTS